MIGLSSNFIGAAMDFITFIATLICLWIMLKDRQLKRVSYEFRLKRRPLSRAKPEIQEKARTLSNGKFLIYGYRVIARIANTGTAPVETSDYDRPLSIEFESSSKVLVAEVSDIQPTNLEISIVLDERAVKINPLLLNPGDWIECTIWVTGNKPKPRLNARFVGIPQLTVLHARQKFVDTIAPFAMALLAISFLPAIPMTIRGIALLGFPVVFLYDWYGIGEIIRDLPSIARYLQRCLGNLGRT